MTDLWNSSPWKTFEILNYMAGVHTAHIETSEHSHVRTYVHMFEVQSCGRGINVMALSLDVRENVGSAVQYSLYNVP